ncbi:sodium-dependent transporter [Maledivibacter halophilus]|uniref:Transporter n=1 Tax=Maledivibacter halophilus TaxID=36842 RepID=A0A1T5L7Z8_9FIRM|nr:sodium-dependent transporter [Maledivibacter halophilus]SKC72073.1 neurotransmitter:Na+ symporter, NSS family [Maledivibacter halophilus]
MEGNQIKQRENWGSRIGFLMAAAGSAVGLGNIWRFPYTAGENGGGAFVIIYTIFALIIGISIMLAEFTVGRRTSLSAVGAYKSYSKKWTFAGALGVLSAFFIMGFYPVVGGWSLAYVFKSFSGLLANPEAIGTTFEAFMSNPIQPIIWMIIYLALNVIIVAKGISGGIEKAGKVLMPTLFVLLIFISIRSISLPGASAGLEFLFKPDWSKVNGATILAALGQAFFSLSLGMGCMITYGSYLSKSENLPSNATIVTILDTCIAILAGIAIFPGVFAFGLEPTAGPGLVFVVVPSVFAELGGAGVLFSVVFFIAFTVAALTSSVSLLEVVTSYLIDQKNVPRKTGVTSASIIMIATSILSSLSLGVMSGFKIFGAGIFDFLDILTDKIFLAIGGMFIAIFTGWVIKKEDLKEETTNGGKLKFSLFEAWYFLLKYVIPILIFFVALMGIFAIEQTSLMIFGVLLIVVLAIFSKKL